MKHPEISVVIPVYNEEDVLELLYKRLVAAMDNLGKSYEVILVNDGSRDNSAAILAKLYKRKPENIRVINFNSNYGQHIGRRRPANPQYGNSRTGN